MKRWSFPIAAGLVLAPVAALGFEVQLPVELYGHTYALPVGGEPVSGLDTGIGLAVDLSSIAADALALAQKGLDLPNDRCGLEASVSKVEMSPVPDGTRVGVFISWQLNYCIAGHRNKAASGHSRLSATLAVSVKDRTQVVVRVKDIDSSGEIGKWKRDDISRRVETAVERAVPAYDVANVLPAPLQAFLGSVEVSDVALRGGDADLRLTGTLVIEPAAEAR